VEQNGRLQNTNRGVFSLLSKCKNYKLAFYYKKFRNQSKEKSKNVERLAQAIDKIKTIFLKLIRLISQIRQMNTGHINVYFF